VNEQILMKLAEAEKKSGLTETQRAMLGGAIGAASGWSLGGVLLDSPAARKRVAVAAGAGALLGLGDTALRKRLRRQAAEAALQKEAAYGDAVKALGRKTFKAAEDAAIDKFLQSKTKQDFRRAALQIDAIRAADRFVRENAKGITTGALTVGTSGALAGARALITRQREREKNSELLRCARNARTGQRGEPSSGRHTAGNQQEKKTPGTGRCYIGEPQGEIPGLTSVATSGNYGGRLLRS